MKFQIERDVLLAELALLAEVVEPNAAFSACHSLLLEAAGNQLTLSAFGASNHLRCQTEAAVIAKGRACLPARKLFAIVRQLPKALIHFSATAENVTMKCNDSRFRLNAAPPDDFPAAPDAEEFTLTMPSRTLATMIRATLFAASKNVQASQYALEGAQLTFGPEGARMIATDGHRLMCVERLDVTQPETISLLIPKASFGVIVKLLDATEGDVRIQPTENSLLFQTDQRRLACTLLTGQYPDVTTLLNQQYHESLLLDGAEFRAAITRTAIFGADGTEHNFGLIKLLLKEAVCELWGTNPHGGESQEEVLPLSPVNVETTISFNGRYLQDFARAISGSHLTIRFNDADSSVEFRPTDTSGLQSRYILMPCRI